MQRTRNNVITTAIVTAVMLLTSACSWMAHAHEATTIVTRAKLSATVPPTVARGTLMLIVSTNQIQPHRVGIADRLPVLLNELSQRMTTLTTSVAVTIPTAAITPLWHTMEWDHAHARLEAQVDIPIEETGSTPCPVESPPPPVGTTRLTRAFVAIRCIEQIAWEIRPVRQAGDTDPISFMTDVDDLTLIVPPEVYELAANELVAPAMAQAKARAVRALAGTPHDPKRLELGRALVETHTKRKRNEVTVQVLAYWRTATQSE